MNRLQKEALGNLILVIFIFPFTALLTFVSIKIHGRPLSIELVTQILFISTMLFTVANAIQQVRSVFRKRKADKEIFFDERDQFIVHNALRHTYYAICLFLIAVYILMSPYFGENITIPFYILPLVICGIAITVILVYSISILIQYGRGGKDV